MEKLANALMVFIVILAKRLAEITLLAVDGLARAQGDIQANTLPVMTISTICLNGLDIG